MRRDKHSQKALRALASMSLLFFALQSLVPTDACACGNCAVSPAAKAQPANAKPVVEHACCHHAAAAESGEARPEAARTAAPECAAAPCTCGDHADRAPIVQSDTRAAAPASPAGEPAIARPVRVDTVPISFAAGNWRQATGPPGTQLPIFLRQQALLI